MDDVGCRGTESTLLSCINNGIGVHDCGHNEDASVGCLGKGLSFHMCNLRLKVTINCAGGFWDNRFNISKTITDIYLKQVTVQQHMKKKILFGSKKASVYERPNAFESAIGCIIQTLLQQITQSSILNFFFFFFCITTRYLIGRYIKISGALCILLAVFVGI